MTKVETSMVSVWMIICEAQLQMLPERTDHRFLTISEFSGGTTAKRSQNTSNSFYNAKNMEEPEMYHRSTLFSFALVIFVSIAAQSSAFAAHDLTPDLRSDVDALKASARSENTTPKNALARVEVL